MPWPQTGAPQYHAQVGLPDKDCTIKWLVVCNDWDLESLDLLRYESCARPYKYCLQKLNLKTFPNTFQNDKIDP